jgi:hypothetical protein
MINTLEGFKTEQEICRSDENVIEGRGSCLIFYSDLMESPFNLEYGSQIELTV